jgi:ankyrin repeat protein
MSRYDKWPLHTAATARDLNAAQAALRNGCKVDQPNETGLTPLMCAALVNCRPMTEELLANGADVR